MFFPLSFLSLQLNSNHQHQVFRNLHSQGSSAPSCSANLLLRPEHAPPQLFNFETNTSHVMKLLIECIFKSCDQLYERQGPIRLPLRMHELRLSVNQELFRYVDGSTFYDRNELVTSSAFLQYACSRDPKVVHDFIAEQKRLRLEELSRAVPGSDPAVAHRNAQTIRSLAFAAFAECHLP